MRLDVLDENLNAWLLTAEELRSASETILGRLCGQRSRRSGGDDSGHHLRIEWLTGKDSDKSVVDVESIARKDRMVKIDDNPWKIDARYWFDIYVLFRVLVSVLLSSPDSYGNSNGAESNIRGALSG